MAFVDYEYYCGLYGTDAINEQTFNRVLWNAEKLVCDYTTGVDGICKARETFPINIEDVEAVKRCVCELVCLMEQIDKANAEAVSGKVVSSVSAGNESISYSVNGGLIGAVLSDKTAQDKLFKDTVEKYLRGTKDKNGVNLLFAGVYPFIIN